MFNLIHATHVIQTVTQTWSISCNSVIKQVWNAV